MASKGRKQSRKRKTQVRVDDPEFIGTIYHGIEESLPLHKENPTQPQLDEPRGASDGGEELNQDAEGSNARVEEPIIDSEAANDGGEELNKDSEAATACGEEPNKEAQGAKVRDEDSDMVQPRTKKHRGPTKMKDIARDPNARIKVEFTEFGEPCGEGSVKLSSYLGPLVREHVPVVIDDWRKIGEERKTVLWKSVKVFLVMLIVIYACLYFFLLTLNFSCCCSYGLNWMESLRKRQ